MDHINNYKEPSKSSIRSPRNAAAPSDENPYWPKAKVIDKANSLARECARKNNTKPKGDSL